MFQPYQEPQIDFHTKINKSQRSTTENAGAGIAKIKLFGDRGTAREKEKNIILEHDEMNHFNLKKERRGGGMHIGCYSYY